MKAERQNWYIFQTYPHILPIRMARDVITRTDHRENDANSQSYLTI